MVKYLTGSNAVKTAWEWVEGHAVQRKGRNNCTLPEKRNDQANRLAKNALLFAIAGGHIISGDFLFEPVAVVALEVVAAASSGAAAAVAAEPWRWRQHGDSSGRAATVVAAQQRQ